MASTDHHEDAIDEGSPRTAPTVQHIRANSTIMHVRKILGEARSMASSLHRLWFGRCRVSADTTCLGE